MSSKGEELFFVAKVAAVDVMQASKQLSDVREFCRALDAKNERADAAMVGYIEALEKTIAKAAEAICADPEDLVDHVVALTVEAEDLRNEAMDLRGALETAGQMECSPTPGSLLSCPSMYILRRLKEIDATHPISKKGGGK